MRRFALLALASAVAVPGARAESPISPLVDSESKFAIVVVILALFTILLAYFSFFAGYVLWRPRGTRGDAARGFLRATGRILTCGMLGRKRAPGPDAAQLVPPIVVDPSTPAAAAPAAALTDAATAAVPANQAITATPAGSAFSRRVPYISMRHRAF